jgi:hypothetical protein
MEAILPGLVYFAVIAYMASLVRRLVLATERIAAAAEQGGGAGSLIPE